MRSSIDTIDTTVGHRPKGWMAKAKPNKINETHPPRRHKRRRTGHALTDQLLHPIGTDAVIAKAGQTDVAPQKKGVEDGHQGRVRFIGIGPRPDDDGLHGRRSGGIVHIFDGVGDFGLVPHVDFWETDLGQRSAKSRPNMICWHLDMQEKARRG